VTASASTRNDVKPPLNLGSPATSFLSASARVECAAEVLDLRGDPGVFAHMVELGFAPLRSRDDLRLLIQGGQHGTSCSRLLRALRSTTTLCVGDRLRELRQ
jgi:hypothetical protein